MSASIPNDGSEDVNDFLQRIKELGDKRDQEDEERNRLLEEEILKGRAERQARRAGRWSPMAARCRGVTAHLAFDTKRRADHRDNRTSKIDFPHQVLSCQYADRG